MAYYTAAHGVPFLLTLLNDPPFSPLQGATSHLLRELRAASSPVGPAPQRMAQYCADALASRVAGDGIVRYAAELPRDKEVRHI